MSIEALRESVDSLAENFSEIETDLESSTYQVLQPHIAKAQAALDGAASAIKNAGLINRLLILMAKHPELTLNEYVIRDWERYSERNVVDRLAQHGDVSVEAVPHPEEVMGVDEGDDELEDPELPPTQAFRAAPRPAPQIRGTHPAFIADDFLRAAVALRDDPMGFRAGNTTVFPTATR